MTEDNWIELHRHFSDQSNFRASRAWDTIKQNILLCSALTSLAAYSIIYIYTSEFFWKTNSLTCIDRFAIRLSLIVIPAIMFFINYMFYRNFRRQCNRMYRTSSIIIKIEEKMGLYDERTGDRERFPSDKWYIPNKWKEEEYPTSKDFVDENMKLSDRFYKNLLRIFTFFGLASLILIAAEIILIILTFR